MSARTAAASLLALLAMAAPGLAYCDQPSSPHPIVGGYRPVSAADAEARAAGEFAVTVVEGRRARLRSIEAAQVQVVQGMNYRLDLTTSGGARWRVTVYRPLSGPMQVTTRERLSRRPAR